MIVSHPLKNPAAKDDAPLAYAVGVSVVVGGLFVCFGVALRWPGWAVQDPLDWLVTGTSCGFIAAVLGLVCDYGCKRNPPVPTPLESLVFRGRRAY